MTYTPVLEKKPAGELLECVDLFCGAGGTSTAMIEAILEAGMRVRLTAINHWRVAIDTHSKNHPDVIHLQQSLDSCNPEDIIPGLRLKLLVASPECVQHSNARGGKPRSDQGRADAWLIQRWVESLYIENLIIENVKEFRKWGPCDSKGKPIKKKEGMFFNAFIAWLKLAGYNVEHRVLNCADYGDPTTRERLFIIARRGRRRKITWPEPTHAPKAEIEKRAAQPSLFREVNTKTVLPWVPARDIIDWTEEGHSVFLTPEDVKAMGLNIRRPLSPNTWARIWTGLWKYSLNDFLMNLKGEARRSRPITDPAFAVTTSGSQAIVEVDPYMLKVNHGSGPRVYPISETLGTLTTKEGYALAVPEFFFNMEHQGRQARGKDQTYVYPMERPVPTIAGQAMFGLVKTDPYLTKYYNSNSIGQSIYEPVPTITANYEHLALINPYVTKYYGNGGAGISTDEPLPTVTGNDRFGLVMPYLVRFKKNQDAQSINDPLKTLTTMESYALVIPQFGIAVDIKFRMLFDYELAAAMSFRKSYIFVGNRKERAKQIGNAVPRLTAKALCRSVII